MAAVLVLEEERGRLKREGGWRRDGGGDDEEGERPRGEKRRSRNDWVLRGLTGVVCVGGI